VGALIAFLDKARPGDECNNKMPVGRTQRHVFLREWRCNVCECIIDVQDSPVRIVRSQSAVHKEHNTKDKVLGNYNHPICGKSIQPDEPPCSFCKRGTWMRYYFRQIQTITAFEQKTVQTCLGPWVIRRLTINKSVSLGKKVVLWNAMLFSTFSRTFY
jgi:hypothetical protein